MFDLAQCYRSCLKKAGKPGIKTLPFCRLSTGAPELAFRV
ncbi:macro domain-containing protein [Desulfosediminicola flagellatus]